MKLNPYLVTTVGSKERQSQTLSVFAVNAAHALMQVRWQWQRAALTMNVPRWVEASKVERVTRP